MISLQPPSTAQEGEKPTISERVDNDPNSDNQNGAAPIPPREDLFAWLQAAGAFILNLNTWQVALPCPPQGLMNAFGVFQTFYQLHLLRTESSSNIAWIGSAQAFLLFLVSLGVGPLLDRGYFRPLLWIGSLFIVLGMFLLSITSRYWQIFLTQSLLTGVGFGCVYLPAPAIISQYFHARAALAMGTASTGSAIGGIIYPIVFTQLQVRVGFGWATRVLAFILLATSALPVLVMKPRTVTESKAPPKLIRSIIDRDALTDYPYLLFVTGLFFGFMGFYIILNYIQLFAIGHSVSSPLANYVLVVLNGSSLIGRLVGGFYADRVGSIAVQALATFIAAILIYSLLAIRTTAGLAIFAILFGIVLGAFTGLPATGVVNLSADKSKIGTRLGMTLAYIGVGVLIGNPIAGAILGRDDWTGLIVFCGSLLVLSGGIIAASRIMKVGWAIRRKL